MKCDAFQDLLDEILDQRQDPSGDAEVQCHAADCAACRDRLHANLQLIAVMPVGERLERDARTSSWTRGFASTLSVAAATILIGFSILVFRGPPAPDVAERPLTVRAAAPVSQGEVEPAPRVELVVSGATTYSPGMHPIISLRLISRTDWSGTLSSVSLPFGAPVELPTLETNWIDAITKEMAPVQSSMTSTFNLLRRTLSAPVKPSAVNG